MTDQPPNSTSSAFDPYHVWLSIAPDEQPPHHYRLLGLKPFESDLRVIESAADRQMAHVRTFQSGKYSKASQKLLNEISSAKLFLLNESKKRAYDDKLRAELADAENPKTATAQPAARAAVKRAAKPAPKTAKPIAAQPDAPSGSAFQFATSESSLPAAARPRKSPNWALTGSVAAVMAVLLIGIVVFMAMQDDGPPVAQVPMPPPSSSVGDAPDISTESVKSDDTSKHSEPQQQSTTDEATDDPAVSPKNQASTSVEPAIEPTPNENPPPVESIELPVEPAGTTEIAQNDADSPPQPAATTTTRVSAGQPIDLIKALAQMQASGKTLFKVGKWSIENGMLRCTEKDGARRIELPYQPNGSYRLRVRFVRREGGEDVILILPVGAGNVLVILCRYNGNSGLHMVNHIHVDQNSTKTQAFKIVNGQEHTTIAEVRLDGDDAEVKVDVDDQRLIYWSGPQTHLSQSEIHKLSDTRAIGVGATGSLVDFTEITVQPLAGKFAVVQLAESDKLPVPDTEETKAAETLVRELFAQNFADANTPESQSKLAVKLLDTAANQEGKPAERFVLMKVAYERAIDAGNVELVAQSVAALAGTFQIDSLKLQASAYARMSRARVSAEESRALAEAMLDLMTDAEAAERYDDIVTPLRTLAGTTAKKTNDTEFRKHVTERLKQSREREAQFDDVRQAIEKLADDDTDAAAHELLGKYLCFVKSDWEIGLSHLAKANDDDLKKLAESDIGDPTSAAEQIALADAWWEHAENEKRDDAAKLAQQARAAFWYEKALPSMSGLQRTKIQQRLDKFAKPPGDKAAAPPDDKPEKELAAGAIRFVPRAKLTDHRFNINGLAFVPGNMLASCDTESIRFWNPKTWTSTVIIDKNQQGSEIYRFAFSPDGKTLAARGKGSVKLWDVATLKIRYEFRKGEVKSLEFSPDGKTLAATFPGGAALFDGSGEERHIDDDARAMLCAAFSPDGRFVAVAGFRGHINVYSVAGGELVSTFGQGKAKQAVAWSPGGKMIAMAGEDPTIELWDVETKKLLGKLLGHTNWVNAATFIPNTSPPILATVSRDGTVRVWNPAARKQIATLPGHQGEVTALAVSPDGTALASGDNNGVILVWEIRKSR